MWKICKNIVDEVKKFFGKKLGKFFSQNNYTKWKYILWSLEWYQNQIFSCCGSRDIN